MKQQDYSLWLANDAVLLVADDMATEQRQAVFDTLIYAQLLANKEQGSRFTNFSRWHGAYVQAISNSGWIITQRSSDCTTGKGDTPVSPTQRLQAWLEQRTPAAVPALDRALAAVTHGSAERMRLRAQQAHSQGSYVAFEVGVVHEGPVIDLCCVFVDCSVPVEQVGLGRAIAGDTLRELWVKGCCATLAPASFEMHRAKLREVVARKQEEFSYLVRLGELNAGGANE